MAMWRCFLLIGVALLSAARPVRAQRPDSTGVVYPDFQLLRDAENYGAWRDSAPGRSRWEKWKYIPLAGRSYLSLGGDGRAEFQVLRNEEWTLGNDDSPLFLRLMLHADWHLGPRWRLFTQLKSGHALGRNGAPVSLNVDRLDLHQFFLAAQFGSSTLEIGRRELSYGARRLISLREGTNVRQSFDGLRWIWRKPHQRLDLLAYAYNPPQTGFFDNRVTTDQLLWGGYYIWNAAERPALRFDLYYLGVANQNPRFEAGSRREVRHSFGVRHWGRAGRFQYNNEAVFQTGTFGADPIRAWTVSFDLSYTPPARRPLVPGLKTEIISGDVDPQDGTLQTFNALYPRGGYFGLLAVIGPANLVDLHPSLQYQPTHSLVLNFDWDFFWRHRLGDGIYFPSGRLNLPGDGATARFIGHQAGLQAGLAISRFLDVEASYFYFFAGPFLADRAGGTDFSQFGTSISFRW